jgi:hypothetical protein
MAGWKRLRFGGSFGRQVPRTEGIASAGPSNANPTDLSRALGGAVPGIPSGDGLTKALHSTFLTRIPMRV